VSECNLLLNHTAEAAFHLEIFYIDGVVASKCLFTKKYHNFDKIFTFYSYKNIISGKI